MKNLLPIFLLLLSGTIQAQEWCGTVVTQEYVNYYLKQQKNQQLRSSVISEDIIGVPVTIHIINRSDGTGGIDISDVTGALEITNSYFTNSNMYFFVEGEVNYINNDEFFDFQRAKEGKLANANDVKSTINIYFANTVTASGNALCGYATFPGGADRVVMARGCTPNGLTLTHELGHYFNLFHPHEIAFGRELVDRSNCVNAGDLLCSTPADPNLTGKVSVEGNLCIYTGTDKDANGDFYAPDITNIMSYSLDACQNSLTGEQYLRMRETLENQRDYLALKYQSFAVRFDASVVAGCYPLTVTFEDTSIGSFSRSWSFPGGTPSSSTNKSPVIRFDSPGSYSVSLQVTNSSGEILTSDKENYIRVIDPLQNISRESFSRIFSEESLVFGDWETINQNPNVTPQLSALSALDDGTGSIIVPNYKNANIGEEEYLVTPSIDFDDLGYVDVSLDLAYAYFSSDLSSSDTLELLYKQRCNTQWNVVSRVAGTELVTSSLESDIRFTPANNDWAPLSIRYTRGNQESGESIHFALRVINGNGNDIYMDNITLAPNYVINAPILDEIDPRSGGRHIIRFTDQSNNESNFSIERSINGGDFVPILTAVRNANAIVDEDITESGDYTYRIRAVGIYGQSPYSNTITVNTTVTSIDPEEVEPDGFKLFPNPANGVFTIESPAMINSVEIFNLSGQQFFFSKEQFQDNSIRIKLNAPAGLYFIKITTSKETKIMRMINDGR